MREIVRESVTIVFGSGWMIGWKSVVSFLSQSHNVAMQCRENRCKVLENCGCWHKFIFFEATKEDKEREIDPKLLFPLKEWLLSWLPGHSFKWDFAEEEEAKLRAEEDQENMPIHQQVRNEKKLKMGYVGTIYPHRWLF